MEPLWKIRSGTFAGCRIDDRLYDASGENVGYFIDDVAYSLNGKYIGELYSGDWIGKRSGVSHGSQGGRIGTVGIAASRYADRAGISLTGWEDPHY
jgi:hypothetical protein